MKEIGGFLELELHNGSEFHKQGIALNSGRNCLRYLIRARKIKTIWLPKLLCSAISDTCNEENVEILYYSIDKNFRPILPQSLGENWLYLINYYGQYSVKEIRHLGQIYKNVIVDNAQAFYMKPIDGMDTIYTCRKFFGVPDGGYLYTDCTLPEVLQRDKSYNRLTFLAGRLECSASEFYSAYRENENWIDGLPLRKMSKVTQNILRGIDYEQIKKVRERNFKYLNEHLGFINELELSLPVGPYMYPLMIKDGAKIREKLQKQKIYIPILWPNVLENLTSGEIDYSLAETILPLPCDQRYGIIEMDHLIQEIIGGKL